VTLCAGFPDVVLRGVGLVALPASAGGVVSVPPGPWENA
jgi:hypothetical protein